MKNFNLLPEVLLRTPALSFSDLSNQLAKMQNEGLSNTLKEVFSDPWIQEALFLGSPSLHKRLGEWLKGEISDDKEEKKLALSLLRYYLRMNTRCTPFGLFAACSMGKWEAETNIVLSSLKNTIRNTRLDMHYLCALTQHLDQDRSIRPFLRYFPNSSLYTFGDKIRFVEYYYQDNNRHHQISAVSSNPYLLHILEKANNGASIQSLASTLVDEEISLEEALEFVHELIDSQLLVSELEPAITGEDLLLQLLTILDRIEKEQGQASEYLSKTREVLNKVRSLLDDLDQHRASDSLGVYTQIATELDQLGIPYDISKLFQVDMGKAPQDFSLKKHLAGQIRKGLEVLNKLHPRRNSSNPQARSNLKQFQDAFYQRYETKEIPLLQVLDNESGIGYLQSTGPGDTHPLIDDIQMPGSNTLPNIQLNRQEAFLLDKLVKAYSQGDFEITIKDEELNDFPSNWNDVPDSLSVMGTIIGTPEGQERIQIKSAGGSSAANLLGRFTHLDSQIDQFTRSITQEEQELHPDLVFAEIIHLPEARTGNILMRTQVRAYEIPFLAKSSVAQEKQIALQDLFLSVRGNRLVLWSKELNKEVIPRLSTAHNYSLSALPVYQFLCDLQFQLLPESMRKTGLQEAVTYLAFSWGNLESQFRFLPRVNYGKLLLKRASWLLRKKDYQSLIASPPDKRIEVFQEWRSSLKMPHHIVLTDYDNELYFDLSNSACQELLISILKKRPQVQIKEFLFDPKKAIVSDVNGGKYTNEFIMAFARKPTLKEK